MNFVQEQLNSKKTNNIDFVTITIKCDQTFNHAHEQKTRSTKSEK